MTVGYSIDNARSGIANESHVHGKFPRFFENRKINRRRKNALASNQETIAMINVELKWNSICTSTKTQLLYHIDSMYVPKAMNKKKNQTDRFSVFHPSFHRHL